MSSQDRLRPGWNVLAEAAVALAAGGAARLLVSFAKLAAWLSNDTLRGQPARGEEIEIVRRAIDAWTRRLPIAPKCFARGLAATWMLKRRGLQVQLYYGAAKIDGKLKAHVWVRSGALDVVGCENAGDYALLATFPESPRVSAG